MSNSEINSFISYFTRFLLKYSSVSCPDHQTHRICVRICVGNHCTALRHPRPLHYTALLTSQFLTTLHCYFTVMQYTTLLTSQYSSTLHCQLHSTAPHCTVNFTVLHCNELLYMSHNAVQWSSNLWVIPVCVVADEGLASFQGSIIGLRNVSKEICSAKLCSTADMSTNCQIVSTKHFDLST